MDLDARTRWVSEQARELGFDLCGVAPAYAFEELANYSAWLDRGYAGEMDYLRDPRRCDPRAVLEGARSLIVVALNYNSAQPYSTEQAGVQDRDSLRGWISRYAWGDDYHDLMKRRLEELLESIRLLCDYKIQGRIFVDSGPVLERDFAGVAGLGWIGKNTHLISPKRGSWFFLGELFVDLPLAYDRPIRDRCGRCELCLSACPTGAFVGPYVLDARRCISYLTIELKDWMPRAMRPLVGNHVFGCDICQEVCPYNVKARPTAETAYHPRPGLHAPDLIPLLSLTEADFRRRFRASPILRAKRRGFLRNVAVALGNLKSREAVPALIGCLDDDEELVRGHAAWALGRIGDPSALPSLQRRLRTEMSAAAREEISEALAALSTNDAADTRSQ